MNKSGRKKANRIKAKRTGNKFLNKVNFLFFYFFIF